MIGKVRNYKNPARLVFWMERKCGKRDSIEKKIKVVTRGMEGHFKDLRKKSGIKVEGKEQGKK